MNKNITSLTNQVVCLIGLLLLSACVSPAGTVPPTGNVSPINPTTSVQASGYASISGHVYSAEDGKPLVGAIIQVWPKFVSPYVATTDAQGKYTVAKLPEIDAKVTAGAVGYVPKFNGGSTGTYIYGQTIPLKPGANVLNVDFVLEKGGTITGQVSEPDGFTPAKGAYVTYIQKTGISTPGLWHTDLPQQYPPGVQTDENGSYSIAERLTGIYDVAAVRYSDNLSSLHAEVSVTVGQTSTQNFVLSK